MDLGLSRWVHERTVTLPAIETWNDRVPPSFWQRVKRMDIIYFEIDKNLWGKASKDHMGKRKTRYCLWMTGGSCHWQKEPTKDIVSSTVDFFMSFLVMIKLVTSSYWT
jgi:hypothetical protein